VGKYSAKTATVGGKKVSDIRENGVYVNEYFMKKSALELLIEVASDENVTVDQILNGEVEVDGEPLWVALKNAGLVKSTNRSILVTPSNHPKLQGVRERCEANPNALAFIVGQLNSSVASESDEESDNMC
jgi:hypothetical protein